MERQATCYLGGTAKGLGGIPLAIGGVSDHVHILVGLKPSHCVADFVRDIKKSSSRWVHEDVHANRFAWQEGYGVFSAGSDGVPAIRTYIATQEAHHRVVSFRDEFLALCEAAGVDVDMRYFD